MESLAMMVAGLMLISLLSGPIAVLLTRFKSENLLLTILRRFIQALLMLLGFYIGFQFLTSEVLPLQIHVVGLYAVVTNYIALRREYFPTFFVLDFLKIPVPKWSFWRSPRGSRRGRGNINGGTSFNEDGNGPSGQS